MFVSRNRSCGELFEPRLAKEENCFMMFGLLNFQAIQMFVARFCDLLDVEITCDGCGVTLPGRRYRCVQCVDMDLCTTCYSGKLVLTIF